MKKVKIIGCGLSGITAAILLKEKGYDVKIFEKRNHIGGNCFDSNLCGTMVHNYGPHIFHTDDEEVFAFLSRYTDWIPFKYQPKGETDLGLISLPYSKKTIKELGRELSADEIKKYLFKDYSEKQWGVSFDKIPKTITNRIPDTAKMENPTWFKNDKYQCLPKNGYTKMIEKMLDGIDVKLSCHDDDWKKYHADITIYTGKIDEFYNYKFGRLPYRSLKFKHTVTDQKMPYLVENSNTKKHNYTRKYDHSYFDPNHNQDTTVVTEEYPIEYNGKNIPFYPIHFGDSGKIASKYIELSKLETNIYFIGRLATYKYLDMWMAIKQCMLKLKKL
jgi:UDP-galactopyranose mutase